LRLESTDALNSRTQQNSAEKPQQRKQQDRRQSTMNSSTMHRATGPSSRRTDVQRRRGRNGSRLARIIVLTIMVLPVVAGCTMGGGGQPTSPAATPTAATEAATSPVAPATTSPVGVVTATPASSPVAAAPRASPAAQGRTGDLASIDPNPAERVYQQNQASVVSIISLAAVPTRIGPTEQRRGIGSGFVLDQDGHIVTNNHVIEQADQLTVTFADPKRTVVPARLVGRDPDNDLAIIKVDPSATTGDGTAIRQLLDPVTLGNMDGVRIGQDAIAIGSPLGLQQTVT
jgi:S1-C subfamily serine protease